MVLEHHLPRTTSDVAHRCYFHRVDEPESIIKLVRDEPESAALRMHLERRGRPEFISSVLLTVEARRAALRTNPRRLPRVDAMLTAIAQVDVSAAVIDAASRLPVPSLRSLDAIHLATALLLRDELDVLLTYDENLAGAARAHDIPVAAPGS